MKLGNVADIRIGTQLNKAYMVMTEEYPVMNGGIKPSDRHNQFNAECDSIAISQGGASAGHVNFMPIRFWAGAHCFVAASKNPDVMTKHPCIEEEAGNSHGFPIGKGQKVGYFCP